MNKPLVSIIIPNYNRAHLIGETLDSVLIQTYKNWECIIVDDGSTDNSKEVIQEYVDKDKRFQIYDRPVDRPKGANACRNYGYELSKGEFINWLDSDDLFSNDKIEEQVRIAQTNEDKNVIITSKWNYFTKINNIGSYKNLDVYKNYNSGYDLIVDFGKTKHMFPPHSYLISRNITSKSGLWDEELHINQDGEFMVRALLNTNKVLHPKKGISHFRSHEGDRISNYTSDRKIKDAIKSWKMIINYLDAYNPENKHKQYIENAKAYLYVKIKNSNRFYLYKNFFFLKEEFYKYSYLSQKLIILRNKTKTILNKNK